MIARYVPRKTKDKDKPPVRVSYRPGWTAYLIVKGPQQSEIRWTHNKRTEIICNEFIERI